MLKVGPDKPIELEGKVLDTFMTIDKVLLDLQKRKLIPVDPPEGDMPEMPEDLGALPNRDVSSLFSKLLSYQNFVATELALAAACLTQEKNRNTYIKAKLKKDISKKEDIETHPVMLDAKVELQMAEQRMLLVEALNRVLSNNLKIVSRSIELRKLDFDSHNRDAAIGRQQLGRADEGGRGPWKER